MQITRREILSGLTIAAVGGLQEDLYAVAEPDYQVIHAPARKNITLYQAYGQIEGRVWVYMHDSATGQPVKIGFWSNRKGRNHDHGFHHGSFSTRAHGPKQVLRAGYIDVPTTFLITDRVRVQQAFSAAPTLQAMHMLQTQFTGGTGSPLVRRGPAGHRGGEGGRETAR